MSMVALVFAADYAQAYEWIFGRPDLEEVAYFPMDPSDNIVDLDVLHPELKGADLEQMTAFVLPGAENTDVYGTDWASVVAVR